jgi:hypothetical protein
MPDHQDAQPHSVIDAHFDHLATFTYRMTLPVSPTMQTLVSLTDTPSPTKWPMMCPAPDTPLKSAPL